jgi:hypothetical protein
MTKRGKFLVDSFTGKILYNAMAAAIGPIFPEEPFFTGFSAKASFRPPSSLYSLYLVGFRCSVFSPDYILYSNGDQVL